MDVQAKINCSLDDLVKLQRKAPRGSVRASAGTPQKKAATQHLVNRGGINKKPQNRGRQQPSNSRQQQQANFARQQQKNGNFVRQQPQKPFQRQQHNRTPSVAEKINLPLDAVIAKQQQQKWQQRQQQTKQQQQRPQQQRKSFVVGKKQFFTGRRAGFIAPRDAQRRGRLQAAADAARAAARSAAAKSAEAVRYRGGRVRTPHQQVVETLKSAAAFKPSAARLSRSSYVYARDRTRTAVVGGGRRFANGRLALRRRPVTAAAVAAASRANTSLARRRPLGPAATTRRNTTTAAKTSTSYSAQQQYSAPAATPKPMPVDRRRPASPPEEAAPSFALEPEMLANIKIMATLDTVPAPLPQQRGAHVAIPAAMQQQQQQPSRAVGTDVVDAGTLSSRFGY